MRVIAVVAEMDMGKPLFNAPDGGRIDILREWEDPTKSELQQGSETLMLIRLKVRPEALPRQRVLIVMTGMLPKGSTDQFAHVRTESFCVNSSLGLTKNPVLIYVSLKPNRLLKNSIFAGCSKMPRCKAPEILRNEAYLDVRRNDEG